MMVRFLARHFRSPRKALATDHPPHIPVAEGLHALESRYMFDAAGVATGAEVAADAVAQEQSEQAVDDHPNDSGAADAGETSDASPADNADVNDQLLEALATHQPPEARREVVFVDTSVGDYQTLIAGIDPRAEVVLLDATQDGVEQIAEALAGRSHIDAIHIVSHGSQAELQLGAARLTLDSMTGRYADELAAIGQTLTDEADILIYGCDFGRGQLGQEAAITLATITGSDVAASEDPTGSAALGGDWDLEFRAGSVETTAVLSFEAQASFMGLLAPPSIDLDANDSSGALGADDYTARYAVAGGSLPVTDIDARLADGDSATLSSLTVTLTNRPNGANEILSAVTAGTSITASYNSGTGVLTLSGADTVGHYQQVLRTVAYENSAALLNRTDRIITFVANDGASSSNTATTTVRWENVRDDFTPIGVETAYNGNDGSANWSTAWQEVGESDGPSAGEVRVTSGSLEIRTSLAGLPARGAARQVNLNGAASAVLSFSYQQSSGLANTSEAYVQVSSNGGGSWTTLATYDLDSSDATPIAEQFDLTPYISFQTQIQFITNAPSFGVPASSISFDDIDISYDAPGAAPSLDLDANDSSGAVGANFATTFTEDGGPVSVADTTDAIVSDADSTNLTELIVTIINPLDGAAESLSWNTGATGIMANYDSATFTLTLSGNNAIANYEQVLRTITYDNTSQSPNTTAPRTITFQASDGIEHSNVAFATVTVIAVNDAPVNTVPASIPVTEDVASALTGISIADVDAASGNVLVTFSVPTGTLAATSGGGVIVGGSGSALTMNGTVANINAFIAASNVSFTTALNATAPVTLTVTTDDQGNSGSGIAQSDSDPVTLTITPINDAPTTSPVTLTAIAEDSARLITQADLLANATDVDGPALSATGLTIFSGSGSLVDNGDGTWTYTPALNDDTSVSFSYSVTDGSLTAAGSATLDITPVNDAPILTPTAAPLSYTENAGAVPLDNGLTLSDVDSPNLSSATVQITGNYLNGEDVLSFTNQLGITGSWNAATGTLTLTGTTTLANYQTALRTIAYTNFSDGPSTLVRTVSFVVNDGTVNSAVATRTINITAVNDAPIITNDGGGATASLSVTENQTAVTTVTSSDVDGGVPAYSIVGGADAALFSVSAATGALSFNAAPDFEAPADAGANNVYDVTVEVNDGNGGTDLQAIAVPVTNVNEPPVVNDQAFAVAENSANGTPVGTVTASDVDAGDSRTFSIILGNTGGAFSIDAITGQITVANTAALDFETNPTFTLTVQVQDLGGLNDTATVTVNLTDLNDAPVITSNGGGASASVSIPENTTAVTTVSATDADLPAQILSYAISGADAALFTIDSATGVLRFSVAPDFETPADANADNVYEVTLRASDGGLADTQALSVTVTPINDAPLGTDTAVTINEDTTYRFAAVDFGFTDPDPGDVLSAVRIDTRPAVGSLTLSGVAVSAGQLVSVADLAAGKLLFTPAPDANGAGYASFSFSVRDTGGPTFDLTPNTMTMNVAAVNDAPVNTVPAPQTFPENTALALSGVSVNDPEGNLSTVALSVANGTLTVMLQGGTTISAGANGSADLTLSGTQADLTATLASLVYQGNYIGPDTLTVTSTDSSSASDSDTIVITVVAVAPTNTAPPGTGDGTPEGPPSAPGPAPSPDDSLPSKVDDGISSKTGFERTIPASDDSRVTTSASSTRAPAVPSKDFGSDNNFIGGTSQGSGSKPPVAKETNAVAASTADVQEAKDPYSTLKDNRFVEELNRLRDNMNHPLSLETVALSMGLSVGYAIWLLRGGVLLSSLLSSLPAWRWLDPLPVLAHLRDPRDDEEGDEDSLQAVLKNAEAREPSKPIPDLEVVPPAQQAATGAVLSPPDATASLQEKAEISL